MERFHIIDEAVVILRARGVFKQAKVFRRGDALYAAAAGGYVRLYKNGGTSHPTLSWEDMDVPGYASEQLAADVHGKLSLLPKGVKEIEGTRAE